MVQAGASPVRQGLVKGGSKSVPSLRDSGDFSTLPSTPPSATCWARLESRLRRWFVGLPTPLAKAKVIFDARSRRWTTTADPSARNEFLGRDDTIKALLRGCFSLGVELLQGVHTGFAALQGGDAFAGGTRGGERGDGGNARGNGGAADGLLVEPGLHAMGGVDDQLNALALDEVNHVGTAFLHLVHAVNVQPGFFQHARRPVGGDDAEAEFDETLPQLRHEGLVAIVGADEYSAGDGQYLSGGRLCLGESFAEVVSHSHDLAGGLHLRAEHGVHAGELAPGKDRRLHEVEISGVKVGAALDVLRQELAQFAARHQASGDLGQRDARRFRDVRHGARGARIDFDDEDLVALDGVLHVHQADNLQRAGQPEGVLANGVEHVPGDIHCRQYTG